MKKILIISEHFAPQNTIGAIRPTKLAKYLRLTGKYEISVLAAKKQDVSNDEIRTENWFVNNMYLSKKVDLTKLLNVFVYHIFKKRHTKKKSDFNDFVPVKENERSSFVKFVKYSLDYLSNLIHSNNAKKIINTYSLHETDIVFSTYGPFSSHLIARYLKKKNKKLFWIADFRDPAFNWDTPLLFKRYAKYYAKKICNSADVATAVSQGFLDLIIFPDIPRYVISNGFDPDDITDIEIGPQTKITFSYTGTLYHKKRNLEIFFKVIRELLNDDLIFEENIQINYAGRESLTFLSQIEKYNLNNITKDYGYISRKKALEVQVNSHILLSSSWNTDGSIGVVTGKLLEYMMMGKPVISIISGELPNSAIKEITHKCNLGFCYEEAEGHYYSDLKTYVLDQYNCFIKNGTVIFEANIEEINKYNYKNITSNLERLFPD